MKIILNETIEISSMIIVARVVFHENNKYYSQVFLDECFYKLETQTRKLSCTTMKKQCLYILLAFY